VVLQVAQPRLLELEPDALVEPNRLHQGELHVRRFRSDVAELLDLVRGEPPVAEERPECSDLLSLDVQDARAEGSAHPLVQAGAVVVAAQIGDPVGQVSKAVGSVDDHLDSACVSHVGDAAHGEDLARQVDHVGDEDHPGTLRDGVAIGCHDLVAAHFRRGEVDLLVRRRTANESRATRRFPRFCLLSLVTP